MGVETRVRCCEEAIRDLRDDIDYLFRAMGKIEETFEEQELE